MLTWSMVSVVRLQLRANGAESFPRLERSMCGRLYSCFPHPRLKGSPSSSTARTAGRDPGAQLLQLLRCVIVLPAVVQIVEQ